MYYVRTSLKYLTVVSERYLALEVNEGECTDPT